MHALPSSPAVVRQRRTTAVRAVVRRVLWGALLLVGFLALALALGDRAVAAEPVGGHGTDTAALLTDASTVARSTADGADPADTAAPATPATDAAETTTDATATTVTDARTAADIATDTAVDATRTTPPTSSLGQEAREAARTVGELPGPTTGGATGRHLPPAVDAASRRIESSTAPVAQAAQRVTTPVTELVWTALTVPPGTPPEGHDHDGGHDRAPGPCPGPPRSDAGHATDGEWSSHHPAPHLTAEPSPDGPGRGDETSGLRGDAPAGQPLPSLPQAPGGTTHTVQDGNGPRTDQQAAVILDGVRLALWPGEVVPADGTPTRERHPDIPTFPG